MPARLHFSSAPGAAAVCRTRRLARRNGAAQTVARSSSPRRAGALLPPSPRGAGALATRGRFSPRRAGAHLPSQRGGTSPLAARRHFSPRRAGTLLHSPRAAHRVALPSAVSPSPPRARSTRIGEGLHRGAGAGGLPAAWRSPLARWRKAGARGLESAPWGRADRVWVGARGRRREERAPQRSLPRDRDARGERA